MSEKLLIVNHLHLETNFLSQQLLLCILCLFLLLLCKTITFAQQLLLCINNYFCALLLCSC